MKASFHSENALWFDDIQTQIIEKTEHAPLDFVHIFLEKYPGIFRKEKGKRLCSLHFQNVQ